MIFSPVSAAISALQRAITASKHRAAGRSLFRPRIFHVCTTPLTLSCQMLWLGNIMFPSVASFKGQMKEGM